MARVPGPTPPGRNASSPAGAWQRLIGRGSTRPGASSMKNCPGRPGSMSPRSTRTSEYGPTASLATTLRRLLLRTDALLQRKSEIALSIRDRVNRRPRAGHGRDARHPRGERRLADQIAVRSRTRRTEGRVQDEIAVAAAD